MGTTRDWRDSFSQLELAKSKKRGKRPEAARAGPGSRVEPARSPDNAGSPPSGPAAVSIPLLPAMLEAAEAEAALILPASEALPKPRKPAKPKPAAKRTRKPAARKPAVRDKQAAKKPDARPAKPRTAAPRRKREADLLAEALAAKLAETPALPMSDLPAPLAAPEPLTDVLVPVPVAPLPRTAALAPYRKGGLIEAIGFWLRTTARRAKAKVGASRSLATSVERQGRDHELEELKAENERLRRQLDALLALSDAAQFKFQS